MNKELVGNVIEQAVKVTSFRKTIREVCRKNSLEYPLDEKIAEWIEQGNSFNVDKFISDYTEHEGIFRCLRTPLEDFKAEINSIQWGNKPTEDEIVAFFNQHGNNIGLFCNQRTISDMKPLERKTYLKTIEKLSEEKLVKLWNTFIEESAQYGEDSYIYDLANEKDSKYLWKNMDGAQLKTINNMVTQNNTRFIQWFSLNGNSIKAKSEDDIKSTITCFWSEIFERIMLYPSAYNFNVEIYCEGDASTYFDDVFFPIIAKEVGYLIDGDKGIIKEIEK